MAPLAKTQPQGPSAVTTQQHNKKQTQQKRSPVKSIRAELPPVVSHHAATASAYVDFKAASGVKSQGVKEVIIDMTDYADITGVDWTAVGYQLATLPGYFAGSVIRLLSVMVDVLPPAMTANTATNNVTVLAGVRMVNEGGGTNSPSLCAAKETFIAPSNMPEPINVLHANMSQLTKLGFQATSNATGVSEIARVSLLDPDTGAFSVATTLQVRVRIRYAVSLPLRTTATVATSTVANADTIPPFATPVVGAIVFPKVVNMQNAM